MYSPRVVLETPSARRERDYLDAAHRSRELHRGLVTVARSPDEYQLLLHRARQERQAAYFIVLAATGELTGVVNLSDIDRDREQVASLGYYAFLPHAGLGFMREGLALVVAESFGALGLERLDASVQPKNRRSIALVRGLGFAPAGLSAYLKVGLRWRAHERWELRREDWRGAAGVLPLATRVAER
jgi:[ribosomal protein S5]-alanine N-acetyltransferase